MYENEEQKDRGQDLASYANKARKAKNAISFVKGKGKKSAALKAMKALHAFTKVMKIIFLPFTAFFLIMSLLIATLCPVVLLAFTMGTFAQRYNLDWKEKAKLGLYAFIDTVTTVVETVEKQSGFDYSSITPGMAPGMAPVHNDVPKEEKKTKTEKKSLTEEEMQKIIDNYDPKDEYRESIEKVYKKGEIKLLKKAYAQVFSDIDEDLKTSKPKKHSVVTVNGTKLKKGKKHWKSLYDSKYINLGDIIVASDLVLDARDKDQKRNSYSDDNAASKCQDILDYMNDELTPGYFYHIRVSGSTDLRVYTIYTYDITDLFKDGMIDPSSFYSENSTYYDLMKQRGKSMRDYLANNKLVKKLGLKNQTIDKYDNSLGFLDEIDTGVEFDNSLTDLNLTGGNNEEIVWNALKSAGFSDAGCAGVCGNLYAEHGFNTSLVGDGSSIGIAQWTGDQSNPNSRAGGLIALAKSMGKDATDITVQAAYLVQELKGKYYNCIGKELESVSDVTLAADRVCESYERPANYTSPLGHKFAATRFKQSVSNGRYYLDLAKRENAAQTAYALYGTPAGKLPTLAPGGGAKGGGGTSQEAKNLVAEGDSVSTELTPDNVVAYACSFEGNKYVFGGLDLRNGIDCSGFVVQVYAHFGVKNLPHSSVSLRTVGRGVPLSEIKKGDIVCMKWNHVAIYTGNGRLIEASNSKPYPKGGIKMSNLKAGNVHSVRRICK